MHMHTLFRQERFKEKAKQLRMYVGMLVGVIDEAFPEGFDIDDHPEVVGSTGDEPMHSIADQIDNVILSFDSLQRAMGLPEGHPTRYDTFVQHGK